MTDQKPQERGHTGERIVSRELILRVLVIIAVFLVGVFLIWIGGGYGG